MDPVEEECQARRAEERVQRDQQPAAPVLNKGRGRRKTKYHLTSTNVPQNLKDAILDLCRHQLTKQLLRTTQKHRGVEAKRQVKEVQINQIIEEQRNEDADALDYEGQQNRDSNGNLNVDRNIQENILRVVSNIFHSLLVNKY